MTLLTWSNLESVRENFGYPADGTVSAILFITGMSWQKCLGAQQARMQDLPLHAALLASEGFQFCLLFFQFFYAPTTTDNHWKLLFCHMWLWETGQKDLMVPFEVHYIVLNDFLSQQHWQNSKLVGVCRPVLQILTLFPTKKCHFPHPFSDQT